MMVCVCVCVRVCVGVIVCDCVGVCHQSHGFILLWSGILQTMADRRLMLHDMSLCFWSPSGSQADG